MLYFNDTIIGDHDAGNLLNWWQDAGASIPALALPGPGDDVTWQTSCSANTGTSPLVVNSATAGGTVVLGIDLAAEVTVNDAADISGSNITGNLYFNSSVFPISNTVVTGNIYITTTDIFGDADMTHLRTSGGKIYPMNSSVILNASCGRIQIPSTNLTAANIKSGVSILGVTGTVIESLGDAAAGDVKTGKHFSNATTANVAGTMPVPAQGDILPTTTNTTIQAGYHPGSESVTGDANLVAGNIKVGSTIFTVAGTAPVADGNATADQVQNGRTFSNATSNGLTGTASFTNKVPPRKFWSGV